MSSSWLSLELCFNCQEHKHFLLLALIHEHIRGRKKIKVNSGALWIVLISSQLMASLLSSERLIAIFAQHSSELESI